MSGNLNKYNKQQLQAITHKDGPCLIIAGAGTGKTTVITERIAWLISEGLAKTDEILALTFTDKAALQMLERVDVLVPYGYVDIWISTFHAFGDRVLRDNALAGGFNPDFKVMTRAESAVFFREHLSEFDLKYFKPLADPTRFIDALISFFSRAKDEDISTQDYFDFVKLLTVRLESSPYDEALKEELLLHSELSKAYAKYQELIKDNGVIDFGNQFYMALNLFREHPRVLKKYQDQFKYILVDEFQDTNFAQFQIVKLLSGEKKNIVVVADDDQCIYRWRGAAYSNVLNFIDVFPKTKKISLIKNYRSNQKILDTAYRLIQFNNPERFEVKSGIDKKLVAFTEGGSAPNYRHFDSVNEEADWIADNIKEKVALKEFKYGDFAILVRSNSDAQPFLQALNMLGIPWQFSGAQGLYGRNEIKLCLHFLRAVANPFQSLSLFYLASSHIYNLKIVDLTRCMHYSKRSNRALYEIFKHIDSISELKDLSSEFMDKVTSFINELDTFISLSRDESVGRLLYSFLTNSGWLKRLTSDINSQNEEIIQNIAKFFNIVRNFELVAKESRVLNFVSYIDLLIESGDDPKTAQTDINDDLVNVLTIHKAKGLEFRVVFLVSLVNGKFPVRHRKESIELPFELVKEVLPKGDFHLQEERRLFYVGLTRAKEYLYLTSADDYGGKQSRRLSQFVIEALGSVDISKDKKTRSSIEAINRFASFEQKPQSVNKKIKKESLLALSFYQIDDYLTCPLKYKYIHVLRVPILEHHTVIYGRAMHNAVTAYFQRKASGRKMTQEELIDFFVQSFEAKGFLDQKHQIQRFEIGKKALFDFFIREERLNKTPLFIEKDFSFVYENNKIIGRFDRVDKEADGIIIMDYKTSELKKQKDVDKRTKESMQLVLYSMAYDKIFGIKPVRVQLYFLESGLIGTHIVTEKDIERLKNKINQVSQGIRNAFFKAQPGFMACNYCAYNSICGDSAKK